MHGMTQALLDWNATQDDQPRTQQDVVFSPETHTSSRAESHGEHTNEPVTPETAHLDRLSRQQVIDEIITINPSATAEFLDSFSGDRLRVYLTRLRGIRRGRGRDARWVRLNDSPAITAHERLF
ncbi:MAG TPA: hypothetical protein ENK11_10750 [Phycisphaerales bacterium]|nr:hypothetical protein [Phycisphaerales bacterium]